MYVMDEHLMSVGNVSWLEEIDKSVADHTWVNPKIALMLYIVQHGLR